MPNKTGVVMAAFVCLVLLASLVYPIVAFWSCSARLSC